MKKNISAPLTIEEHAPCPICINKEESAQTNLDENHSKAVLVLRYGKSGPFLSCSAYPECKFIHPLHQNDGHIVKRIDGMSCPECNHEGLVVRQGRFGMFLGCECYPDCSYTESLVAEQVLQTVKEYPICPICAVGNLVERHSRQGKVFYACQCYPKCRYAVNFLPIEGKCETCKFPLLIEKKQQDGTVKLQCANRQCGAYKTEAKIEP